MKNLDWMAADSAQAVIRDTAKSDSGDVDNLVTKALGVLQENGVFAFMLFLCSRKRENELPIAETVRKRLLAQTPEVGVKAQFNPDDKQACLSFLTTHVCNDLDALLLVKQLWEQTLIYARYGAKARD